MNLTDIRDYVVRPALLAVGLNTQSRMQMVIGTGAVESGGYNYLDQTTPGPGPAYGFWQMERATHDDLWMNFINYCAPRLRNSLWGMIAGGQDLRGLPPPVTTLHHNLLYAAAMCAVHYLRADEKHPGAGDYEAMAAYWKRWYNTPLGKGTIAKATPYFKEACTL